MRHKVQMYFNQWSNGNKNAEMLDQFIEMLWQKASFARDTNQKIYAYDKTYNYKELEKMQNTAEQLGSNLIYN